MRYVYAFLAAILFVSCAVDDDRSPPVAEMKARRIAEDTFVSNQPTVTEYEVLTAEHTPTHWVFVAEGRGEFHRPGFAWMIKVEKASGEIEMFGSM